MADKVYKAFCVEKWDDERLVMQAVMYADTPYQAIRKWKDLNGSVSYFKGVHFTATPIQG